MAATPRGTSSRRWPGEGSISWGAWGGKRCPVEQPRRTVFLQARSSFSRRRIATFARKENCCGHRVALPTRRSGAWWPIVIKLKAATAPLHPQTGVLPGKSEPGPRADTTGGKLCNFGVPEKDGQSRSASTVPPPWKGRGILPRMDQKQTGATTVSCARPEKSGNRTSLGLPHLQPTAVDPPNQAPRHPCGHLSNNNGQGELPENIPACKDHHSRIASPSFIQAFFTASFSRVRFLNVPYMAFKSLDLYLLLTNIPALW